MRPSTTRGHRVVRADGFRAEALDDGPDRADPPPQRRGGGREASLSTSLSDNRASLSNNRASLSNNRASLSNNRASLSNRPVLPARNEQPLLRKPGPAQRRLAPDGRPETTGTHDHSSKETPVPSLRSAVKF